jgi:hypothetical protein
MPPLAYWYGITGVILGQIAYRACNAIVTFTLFAGAKGDQ